MTVMNKGNRGNSKQGMKRGGSAGKSRKTNANFQSLLKKYATEKNIYMALGLTSALGGLTYLAVKYVPWDKLKDKIEEEFDAIQQEEFSPETVDAL
jgi:hypothetical protein